MCNVSVEVLHMWGYPGSPDEGAGSLGSGVTGFEVLSVGARNEDQFFGRVTHVPKH